MARRGENIYKRKDGRWEGRIPYIFCENKKNKYFSLYAKSYAELKTKMKNFEESKQKSDKKKELSMEDAFQIWLYERKFNWKQSTYACYEQLVEKQIVPIIGNIPLMQFSNVSLNEFIFNKKSKIDSSVSETYLKNMISVILQTLRYFKNEHGYELTIPSVRTKLEKATEKVLPSEQTLKILDNYLIEHCADSTCLGILLCRYTGLRIGEICALRWNDIDMEKGMLYVKRTLQRVKIYEKEKTRSEIIITVPKTKRSNREIPLPGGIKELLKEYQTDEFEYLIQGRKNPYAEPRTLQYRFRSILKKCDIFPFNFHMLRHIFATKCITVGFDVNSLSELLGHSNIQITLNLYVHSSNERKHLLMEQFEL